MSSNVPRRAGQTPTNDGRFRPPSAPAPMSGMRVRRGLTPRSASKKVGGAPPTTIPKRPKLTASKRLEIIRKIQAGDYKPGEGLKQFYELEQQREEAKNSAVSKMTCKQNLFSSFASVDNNQEHPLASSTRNYGVSRGSNDSLVSLSSSVISSVPSHNSTIRGQGGVLEADLTVLQDPDMHPCIGQQGASAKKVVRIPPHIKMLDDLIQDKKELFQLYEKLAVVACRAKLAELLPVEKMFMFLKSIDRVQKILQRYLKGNASENMRMFMPTTGTSSAKGTRSFIHCDVEKSTEAIHCFYKLDRILSKIEDFCVKSDKDNKLETNVESLKECTNELEQLIKKQEQSKEDLKDMIKKAECLKLDVGFEEGSRGIIKNDMCHKLVE